MNDISEKELQKRIQKVQQAIEEAKADGCIISTSVNQYYLTGFIFDGYLYIHSEKASVLFVKRPAGVSATHVEYIRKPEQIPDLLQKYAIDKPRTLLIESDSMPYSAALRLKAAFGDVELKNASSLMRQIRSIKSEYELNQMRACAKIQSQIYAQIPSLYRHGMTDTEFQAEVEYLMRRNGSLGIFRAFGEKMDIFMGSVLAGDNAQETSPFDFSMGGKGLSPYLPIGACGVKLQEGMTIMFDMAGNYTPYQSDMTRTFAIGSVPDLACQAHGVSVELNKWVENNAKPGMLCCDIYNHSLETAHKNGLEMYFMGTSQQAKFVGHGLGLEINEPPVFTPRSNEVLEAGAAFAFEPKFILPGIGAVGVENTFIVTENSVEKITQCDEKLISL